jgi:hypothetical protein
VAQTDEIHFIHDLALGRSVLRQDSEIRMYELEEGLRRRYWMWLCGEKVGTEKFAVGKSTVGIPVEGWRRSGYLGNEGGPQAVVALLAWFSQVGRSREMRLRIP